MGQSHHGNKRQRARCTNDIWLFTPLIHSRRRLYRGRKNKKPVTRTGILFV
jgi:hypothetical protein